MVAWVFAGGGESEIRGLVPFLSKQFKGCSFERKTPMVIKPGPKPTAKLKGTGLGKTGKDLSIQVTKQLTDALKFGTCDLILVLDDLDCCCLEERRELFLKSIEKVAGAEKMPQVIAFAAPEVESWLIADWNNTIAKDVDLRRDEGSMKYFLSHVKKVPFNKPESFGDFDADKKSCKQKLSSLLIEASLKHENVRYSKGIHTPRLLQKIEPGTVAKKCPIFRQFMDEIGSRLLPTAVGKI